LEFIPTVPHKTLAWLHGEIKSPPFSAGARKDIGRLLRRLQRGELLFFPHSRPLPRIGPRCHELRVNDGDKAWRLVYRIDLEAILILDVFLKKDRAIPLHVIETCRIRLRRYDSG
jgi:phage-related protein